MQALASNPLQAAAVGNAAVVSVAERYVLLSRTQVNVFVKPNGQSRFTCILPWREKVHEMTHSMRCRYSWFKSCQKSVSDCSGDKQCKNLSMALRHAA